MAVFHQKVRTVLFARDRKGIVFRNALHDFHVAHVEFVAARGTLVCAHFAGDDHAGLIGQILECVKHFRRHLVFGDHALDDACAVAEDGEDQFAAFALVVEPAANSHGLAVMPANLRDGSDRGLGTCRHL